VPLVRAVAAAALATVATPSQKRGREDEETVFEVVIEPFLQLRVLRRRRVSGVIRVVHSIVYCPPKSSKVRLQIYKVD